MRLGEYQYPLHKLQVVDTCGIGPFYISLADMIVCLGLGLLYFCSRLMSSAPSITFIIYRPNSSP